MSVDEWTLDGPEGLPIHGETDHPACEARGTAILVHGYTGSKDRNIIPSLGALLSGSGITVHRFTMTHAGIGKDADEVTRLDEFARDSTDICMANIDRVLQALRDGALPGGTRPGPLVLIGHSRAGATVLGYTGRRGADPCDGVVSVSGLSDYWPYDDRTAEILEEHGCVEREFKRSPTGFVRMGPSWYEHARQRGPGAAFREDIARIRCPVLLVHGDADANVPLDHPERVRMLLTDRGIPVELAIIAGGDHNLNALGFGRAHENIRAAAAAAGARAIDAFISRLP